MNLRWRNKVNPNFNMSSMTDIVFLLLIFFMLSSTLVTVSAIDVLLPKAGGKTENNASVSISITNQSKFYIDKTAADWPKYLPASEKPVWTLNFSLFKIYFL